MNSEVKEYDSASASEKKFLKKDLKEKMAKLKEEMPENEMVSSHHTALTTHKSFEEEEEEAQKRVERVHQGIKNLKNELKEKVLSSSDKKAAKTLYHQLETEYTDLAAEVTKEGRKRVAKQMKETLAKLRTHMNSDSHSIVAKAHNVSADSTKQAKKDKIMSLVKSTELEYQAKNLPSEISHKIHAKFEQMKDDLKSVTDVHLLKTKLQSTLSSIKNIEKSANDLEEKKEFSLEEDDEVKSKSADNDFEEDDEDDSL